MEPYQEFSWLNDVEVRVAFGEYPEVPPDEVFAISISGPSVPDGGTWREEPYLALLDPVTYGEGAEHREPYNLEVRKTHFSWGADGAGAEILIYIANQAAGGAIGAATMAALKVAFDKLGAMATHVDDQVDLDRARDVALWRVCSAYPAVARDALVPRVVSCLTLV